MPNINHRHKPPSRHAKNKKIGPFLFSRDLCAEILKGLPIKSVCRFRCVCKRWNSLISSHFFINLHLSFTTSATTRNLKPYLHAIFRDQFRYHSVHRECYTVYRPLRNDDHVQHSKHLLYCPFWGEEDQLQRLPYFAYRLTFVDLIHGVLCISYSSTHSSPYFNSTLLWNPSIHKFLALPTRTLSHRASAIGFGYDTGTNDFKVVLIWLPKSTYQVYSTRQGVWSPLAITTSLESCRGLELRDGVGCFVNGTIHWLLSSSSYQHSLLMFDCKREDFTRLDIPEKLFWLSSEIPSRVNLLEYGGMVAALVYHLVRAANNHMDMWVMEEHGVSTSWKKLYRIPQVIPQVRDLDSVNSNDSRHRITIYDASFETLAPYGPSNQWNTFGYRKNRVRKILSDRVYEESMLLMDHPDAQSYTNKEIYILTKDPLVPNTLKIP